MKAGKIPKATVSSTSIQYMTYVIKKDMKIAIAIHFHLLMIPHRCSAIVSPTTLHTLTKMFEVIASHYASSYRPYTPMRSLDWPVNSLE